MAPARGPGGWSPSATATWAMMLGFSSLGDPAVKYRLEKAAGFLNAAMTHQPAAKSAGGSLHWPDRSKFDLIEHLGTLPLDMAPQEVTVHATSGPLNPPWPLCLIIRRKRPEATEATRRELLKAASRKQRAIDPRSLVAAEFLILATSLPVEGYPAEAVLAAYYLRRQIEPVFKRLKSLLHIDRLPTYTDAASRSWLQAHLITALLTDDLSQEVLDSFPSEREKQSNLRKNAR